MLPSASRVNWLQQINGLITRLRISSNGLRNNLRFVMENFPLAKTVVEMAC